MSISGKTLSSVTVKSYRDVAADARKFIIDRKEGNIKSLKTGSPKLDKALMEGLD